MRTSRWLALLVLVLVVAFVGDRGAHAEETAPARRNEESAPATPVFDVPKDGLQLTPGLSLRGYAWKTKLRTADFNVGLLMGGVALRHRLTPHVWTQVGLGLAGTREKGVDDVTKLTVQPAVFFGVGARLVETVPVNVDLLLQGGTAVIDTDAPMYMAMLTFQFSFR